MSQDSKTLYLIDGNAFIHRAYHAIRGLANSKGLPTNAIFGFTKMLIKLMQERRPSHAAALFDARGKTFRHEIYTDYKANRPPMPEDMAVQLPYIKQITEGFNLPLLEMTGFEADDLIGTLARKAADQGFEVVMVTGDKDFMQLVDEHTTIWDPMKEKTLDLAAIDAQFGLTPAQMIDMMGLAGDSSDNIPGVPGIGPKTAVGLIKTFGSLENLYENIDTITKPKQRQNLMDYKDQAFLSRRLVTIETRAPIDISPEQLALKAPDQKRLSKMFQELEFRQLQMDYHQETKKAAKAYHLIQDQDALAELVKRLKAAGKFAVDTETTSEDPMQAVLVGISVCLDPDEAYYIPCGHHYLGVGAQLKIADIKALLGPVLADPGIVKIGQNIKYDWIVFTRHEIALEGVGFDTMLASYLINPSKRAHNLDQIALDFLNHQTIKYKDVVDKKAGTFAQVPLEKAAPYACEDADVTLAAGRLLEAEIEKAGLTDLMQTVEMPLVPVLMKMEMRGICVDPDRLRDLSKTFAKELTHLEERIYQMAGMRFNIKSSQQLGHVLFEKLMLPVQKKTKKKTGYSTDVEVLTALAEHHELPALVLRHRTLAKLKSTYTDALLKLIHPDTGRIHSSFNQTVTATGRLSSSDPNLQNIPIRDEEGRMIRSAFIPKPGWHMISADYSQIELRILAHYADDPILIDAFVNDEDIHARTAGEVFEMPVAEVTPELRRQAKAINFGIVYGMSAFGLARELKISQKMAKTYIEHYFDRYQGVKTFIDQTIAKARQTRRTTTLAGRVRLLPDIDNTNPNVRQFAERIAINTPIQGSAADLIKLAMIQMDAALTEKQLQTAMLLSVHDELIFEVPPDELETVKALVRDVMEGVWKLRLPLKVNLAAGVNWAEVH